MSLGTDDLWTTVGSANAGEALLVQKPAVGGQKHYIYGLEVAVTAAAITTAITISLKDDTTVKWQGGLPASAAIGSTYYRMFPKPIPMSTSKSISLETTAPGGATVLIGNILGYTR